MTTQHFAIGHFLGPLLDRSVEFQIARAKASQLYNLVTYINVNRCGGGHVD